MQAWEKSHINWYYYTTGMGAGVPDFVVVNLAELEKIFEAGSEVTLEVVKAKVLSVSGHDADLPLKVRAWHVDSVWITGS